MKHLLILTFFFIASIHCHITKSDIAFTGSIYKKIASNQGNDVFSPISIKVLLALTQYGCKGDSKSEIERLFNLEEGTQIEKVYRDLSYENGSYILRLASRIYINDKIPLDFQFRTFANQVFDTEIQNVDFTNRENTVYAVNSWTHQQTNNKIRNLVVPSMFDDHTTSLFVNTLYFKADWLLPFPVAYTKELDFYVTPSEVVPAQTMLLHERTFRYAESSTLGCKFLQIPFREKGASMVVVLPDAINGLSDLQNQIKNVLKFDNFTKNVVNVALPKFRVESTTHFKKILKKLGIHQIFDNLKADLSGIAGKKGEVSVNDIIQKSFLDVTETGVEGATGTYALIAIPISLPSNVKDFKVDRPFLFYIKVKNSIVYIGKITDPRY